MTPVHVLDPGGTARLTLRSWPTTRGFWILEQGGTPVGMIKRTEHDTRLQTATERWSVAVRRHGRLGWRLLFTRKGEREAAVQYYPRTLLPGGRLVLSSGARYRLRCPVLQDVWRLNAVAGGEIARICFRGDGTAPAFRSHVMFSEEAGREPLLPVLLLAAGAAIVVHDEQPRTT